MVSHERSVVAGAVIEGVPIIRGLPCAQLVSVLPEHVSCYAIGGQGCGLPWPFDGDIIRCRAILFEDAGLVGGHTGGAMVSYPAIPPIVRLAPAAGVEMESSKIEALRPLVSLLIWGAETRTAIFRLDAKSMPSSVVYG